MAQYESSGAAVSSMSFSAESKLARALAPRTHPTERGELWRRKQRRYDHAKQDPVGRREEVDHRRLLADRRRKRLAHGGDEVDPLRSVKARREPQVLRCPTETGEPD